MSRALPAIVVTVEFEGIVYGQRRGRLSLRDPKTAHIRSDKSAYEADEVEALQRLSIDQRMV